MAAMLAKVQARGLAIRGQIGAAKEQIHEGHSFIAAPVAHLIVNGVNARAAFFDMIRANNFGQLAADFFSVEGERAMRARSVFLEALPVTLEGEYLAVEDVQSREKSPAIQKARLSRRETSLFDGHEFRVVKNKAMEHEASGFPCAIVAQVRAFF